jgi:hypothetical protein
MRNSISLKVLLLLASSFLILPVAHAQTLSAAQRQLMHHETESDAYVPNKFNNNKLSVGYRFQSPVFIQGSASSISTSQVNVGSGGMNMIGDAANEPSIAVNPLNPNEMVMGWRQFDDVSSNFRQAGWGFTVDAGQSWTFPGRIEAGLFRSDPVLEYDQSGNVYYNSLTNTPDYFCKVFKSANGGATWDAGTDAQGGDKQWMTIDPTAGPGNGNIYASWNSAFTTCPPGFFTRSVDNNNSYESCTFVDGDPYWATLAVNSDGVLYVGGANSLNDSMLVARSDNAQFPGSSIAWSTVMVWMDGYLSGWISVNPVGLLGQMNIAVDRSGTVSNGYVYMLASVSRFSTGDQGDVMFVRRTDGGQTWSAPLQVNDDPSGFSTQWFGTMSVAPNGRIDAVWLDTRDDTFGLDSSALYYSFSTDHGLTWSVNEKMSPNFDPHTGYPQQDKMGDYFDMESDNIGAHLAWTNTLNDEQDVYYSHIIPHTNVGLNEVNTTSINVFPNPTSDKLTVACFGKQISAELFSVVGANVIAATTFSNKHELNLKSLNAGIYFLKMTLSDGTWQVRKIIKQ